MKKFPAILAIIFLAISIFPFGLSYYFLKVLVCCVSIYYCIKLYDKKEKQLNYFWYFLIIAVLYNPLIPIYLFVKLYWIIIDIVVVVIYIKFINKYLN